MSTTARKARRRAGIKFEKAAKTGTPVGERSFIWAPVLRRRGDALPAGYNSGLIVVDAPRSPKRVAKFLASGGIR